jgi:hypothetical protein
MEISKRCLHCKTSTLVLESANYCTQCGSILEVEELITYCCWIGNIPTKIDNSYLEDKFNNEGSRFGRIHSVKVELSKQRGINQCYINYYDEHSMRSGVDFFNNRMFEGFKLVSKARLPKNPPPIIKDVFEESILIFNSKYLKKQLAKKVEVLKSIYGPSIELDGNNSTNFNIKLKTADKKSFDQIKQIIKNHWVVSVENLNISNYDKKSVLELNEEFIKIGYKYDSWIEIDHTESIIRIFSFIKTDAKFALNECIDHLKLKDLNLGDSKTHYCWIGNIPEKVNDLERILSDEAIKFGNFASIKIHFNSKYKQNQCHINYFDEDSAINAAKYFNRRSFYGHVLKSTKKN